MTISKKKFKKPNGYVLYKGPSQLDGSPIVCILTGVQRPSSNPKTGSLVIQSWILREDIHPLEAVHSGEDLSICGRCPLRGVNGKGRTCYVNLAGPGQIYKSYLGGQYPPITNEDYQLFRYRGVRLGAYGDPTAVPFDVWDKLIRASGFHLGYTNQWRGRDGWDIDPKFKSICMASCINDVEQAEAAAVGWRTYRVRLENEPILPGEIICPASEEMGYRKTCMECRLCAGTTKQASNVVIKVHGNPHKIKNFGQGLLDMDVLLHNLEVSTEEESGSKNGSINFTTDCQNQRRLSSSVVRAGDS